MLEFRLQGYTLKEKIYDQTNTLVFKAIQEKDGLNVVIKILRKEYPEPKLVALFKQKQEIMNFLDSPNIIKCYELLESYGLLYSF
ncbi:MAG: hypothetical protein N3A69_01320 [Leptospiraceae bacterium]|nr:hypothetical protein [Leptospiraceae bacterium]